MPFIRRRREGVVFWRRNDWRRVEFFNAPILGRGEEEAVPVSKGERSIHGGSWFPHEGVTRGCNGALMASSRSRCQMTSGLTRGGRQLVRLVMPEDRLGRILLCRSNKLAK
jgi:hypothetical protein